jgi:hypothetical protein
MEGDMYCFVTDQSGHWFKIRVSQKQEFEDYVEAMENDIDWEGDDYNQYRCMHPVNYMFPIVDVLKES